jgi:Zn-finger nucleic acid-binding protein
MHCPVCKTSPLQPHPLEARLPAQHCPQCDGNWLNAAQYFDWLDANPTPLAEQPYSGPTLSLADDAQAKLCPECKHIMRRYEVGHDTHITLDQCASCDGMWFDRHEWDALKGRQLHRTVHLVFSAPWQNQIRHARVAAQLTEIHQQRFGDDFARLNDLHTWIHQHPKKADMLAFLQDATPFKEG